MKILVLTWEFPPRIVGGIARHVAELYPELIKLGHDVHLITVESGKAPWFEEVEGVQVHRVPVRLTQDFFEWVANMNESMEAHAQKLLAEEQDFALIHAHDWLVGDAAIALKHTFKLPLIATIHATEYGRYNGLHTPTHRYIGEKERLLIYEAWRVIVCTEYMRHELARAFQTPGDKIDVIYNGIRSDKKHQPHQDIDWNFRRYFAADGEKIVYYVGRITYEKGISVLLNAAPRILWEMGGNAKFVMIGGGQVDALKSRAWELGIWEKCYFTGFMSDETLDHFRTVADCSVFPSLYEPFGIVALESFAARVPVVVSNAGGLPEVVQHNKTGIVTWANHPDSLAWGILEVLKNPHYAQFLVENAYIDLDQRFQWGQLARQTERVYTQTVKERTLVIW